jgi:hypothetical protein
MCTHEYAREVGCKIQIDKNVTTLRERDPSLLSTNIGIEFFKFRCKGMIREYRPNGILDVAIVGMINTNKYTQRRAMALVPFI